MRPHGGGTVPVAHSGRGNCQELGIPGNVFTKVRFQPAISCILTNDGQYIDRGMFPACLLTLLSCQIGGQLKFACCCYKFFHGSSCQPSPPRFTVACWSIIILFLKYRQPPAQRANELLITVR